MLAHGISTDASGQALRHCHVLSTVSAHFHALGLHTSLVRVTATARGGGRGKPSFFTTRCIY